MAKFCSKECEETGAICDHCRHYKDEYKDIKKLRREDGTFKFAGVGICDIDDSEIYAEEGYKCNKFECSNIKD